MKISLMPAADALEDSDVLLIVKPSGGGRNQKLTAVQLAEYIQTALIAAEVFDADGAAAAAQAASQPLDADLTAIAALSTTAYGRALLALADAAALRTAAGLVIGTNVQAYDADLATWAGLTPTANAQTLVTAANYAAMRALLDLEAGTDFYSKTAADAAFQPLDSDLTALAGLTTTSFGRALIELANAAAGRTAFGAAASGANVDITSLAGTATNDDAASGKVGEYLEAEVLVAAQVAVSTATPRDVATLSLTAGDWLVWGNIVFAPESGAIPNALGGWISATSATIPTAPNKGAYFFENATQPTSALQIRPVGARRISLATTTNVYLSCYAGFSGTLNAYGHIAARRER